MKFGLTENTNYAGTAIEVQVEGEKYPLLKTTNKVIFYMKDDQIRRVNIKNVEDVIKNT